MMSQQVRALVAFGAITLSTGAGLLHCGGARPGANAERPTASSADGGGAGEAAALEPDAAASLAVLEGLGEELRTELADAQSAAGAASARVESLIEAGADAPDASADASAEYDAALQEQLARASEAKRREDQLQALASLGEAARASTAHESSRGGDVTLPSGQLKYGPTISLVQLRVARRADEPPRLRNYVPQFELIPPELGFQFTYQPVSLRLGKIAAPGDLKKNGDTRLQIISWGGFLLVRVDDKELAQAAVSLGGTVQFFNNTLGLGLGFDIYRGVKARGVDGASATAYTGLLSWALATEGEVTPENVFLVLSLGLEPFASALAGQLK